MEALFDLLLKSPGDDRLLLTALGVAESEDLWYKLSRTLADGRFSSSCLNKPYLNANRRCLENLNVSQWDLNHIEMILVQCMPRWGALIERGSLGELCGLVSVILQRGLCIMCSNDNDLPNGYVESINRLRIEILRILWYSSAIGTLFQLLRFVPGEEEDSVINLLLENHKDDEARRTVIEAQESSILCLVSLVSLLLGCDSSDSASGLVQLKSTLSEYILAGVSPSDLSSCPFLVSLCSFIIGSGKTKSPPSTIDAACDCLSEILAAFEVPPSTLISAPRFRKLNERLVTSLISSQSDSTRRLLCTIISKLPSIVPLGDKQVSALVQDDQKLFIASPFIAENFSDLSESANITSGRALMLAKLVDSKSASSTDGIGSFLTKSIANVEWIKTDLVPSRASVDLLSNFYSFLQSIRVKPDWVISGHQVHEPTLSHFVFHATSGSSKVDRQQVDEFNTALSEYRMRSDLINSIFVLLTQFLTAPTTRPDDDISKRIRVAILSTFADLTCGVDETVVREYPQVINKLLLILSTCLDHEVKTSGISLSRSLQAAAENERAIMISILLRIVPFTKNQTGMDCFVTGMRCLPHWLLDQPEDQQIHSSDLFLLLSEICRQVHPSVILNGNTDPVILSTVEAIVQFIAKSPNMVACNRTIFDYLQTCVESMANLKSVTNATILVALLSLISSVMVLQEEESLPCGFVDNLWTILSSHPVIQALASAPVWQNDKYTIDHLAWVYVLQLGTVLLPFGSSKVEKFFATYKHRLTSRFTTAHTSDLGSIEEACLIGRLVEAAPMGSIEVGSPLEIPFQFTSLITYKSPGIYPKSRSEKIGGNLESIMFEDVRMPCSVPCVFAQRVVWLATDIVSSVVRRVIRNYSSRSLGEEGTSSLFHSLLDCSHFVTQYLKELTLHEQNVLRLVEMNDSVYVPLSVYIQPGDSVPPDSARTAGGQKKDEDGEKGNGGSTSLLKSLPSPVTKIAVPTLQPRGSLMDSLSPKNASKKETRKSVVFYSPRSGDCPQRAGLSFIAPALVTKDDFVGKLVEVMSLCLIQAMRLANTEALVRPLLDLLMSMKSNADKLPLEANAIIEDLVNIVAPRYSAFSDERRQVVTHHPKQPPTRNPMYPTIGNIRY